MAASASLKFSFCLFLVLLTISNSESRSPPLPLLNKITRERTLMQVSKHVLKASIARQAAAAGSQLRQSKRVSPGGPDGHHH
ncbi:hypothetical protein ACFX13_031636 [Malus domestica]|uniref:Uncharacterized protein n=2 Tax=Malus TaxID=3749 RepID=A0A498K6K4_MALDO|nr:hypothetical protein DVH24_003055 [Malus domestica]TQD76346.1 hypothetical protein C1H46_038126 [Malus baccata]